ISNTTLSNFLLAIAKVHEININVSPDLEEINIINNFSNVYISDLLLFLAKEYQLNIEFTGNIISISKFIAPPPIIEEKKILANFNPERELINIDLRGDPLAKVFRKITDVSGKNLVYAPGMESLKLTSYQKSVPFDLAMKNLALSNNLEVQKSERGFFIFNSLIQTGDNENAIATRNSKDFYFKIIDSTKNRIQVDFKNVPANRIIYALIRELGLDIFTATPLNNLPEITVSAESIFVDQLFEKIFQSINSREDVVNASNATDRNQINNQVISNLTFKKENGIYYFGTENQLTIKDIEIIPMMYRSIEMLSDPTNNFEKRRQSRNSNFISGSTNYYGQNNPRDDYNNVGNQRNYTGSSNADVQDSSGNIFDIIPNELLDKIDLKIDRELNSFIVSGPSRNIEHFKNFVEYIDRPVPVILIEVMILEVNKSALVETGVTFGLGEEEVQTEGQAFPSANMRLGAETVNRVIGGFDAFSSLNIGQVLPNFYMDIKAMESNGNLKILSTPKLSTLNGHKAYLSSGQTTYYAVTNQNFFGSQIPQTSEITNYYPIDAELALEIMPIVAGNGEITMDINVIQSSFNGERIAENAPPGMNSREFSSIIRMRDKDVAILGGIEQRTKDDSGSGVPFLARIPIIKWLFSERRREDSKKKLNILIKPTVIY
ncbi:type II secretion system protein GspD, partial [Christiangramia marina]|uniref:type II secretion system protein GspD n=1 Tax=Christiangramia marina TaxID=409436 RepID=UPI003AA989D7